MTAKHAQLSGSGLRVTVVNVPTTVSLLVRNAAGKAVAGVDLAHVRATLNGEPLLVVADASAIGQFSVTYTVREVGMHRLGVQVCDEYISGNEFAVAGVCNFNINIVCFSLFITGSTVQS